jgi:hypothetical protein
VRSRGAVDPAFDQADIRSVEPGVQFPRRSSAVRSLIPAFPSPACRCRRVSGTEQFRQRDIEGIRQFYQILQRRVPQCTLNSGEVRPVHIRFLRQPFLRPFLLPPEFAQTVGEVALCLGGGNQTPIV